MKITEQTSKSQIGNCMLNIPRHMYYLTFLASTTTTHTYTKASKPITNRFLQYMTDLSLNLKKSLGWYKSLALGLGCHKCTIKHVCTTKREGEASVRT